MAACAYSVLRSRDLKAEKSYLDVWKAGKLICCPHKDCIFENALRFAVMD